MVPVKLLLLVAAAGIVDSSVQLPRFRLNLTESVDRLLPLVSRLMIESGLDPLSIPAARRTYRIAGPFPFPASACAEFTYSVRSTELLYLSELERRGPVIVEHGDRRFSVHASVALADLWLISDYFLRLFLVLRQRGKVLVKASSIRATIRVQIDPATCALALTRFELDAIERIRVFVDGNGLAERALVAGLDAAMRLARNWLRGKIETRAASFVREHLERIEASLCSGRGLRHLGLRLHRLLHRLLVEGRLV